MATERDRILMVDGSSALAYRVGEKLCQENLQVKHFDHADSFGEARVMFEGNRGNYGALIFDAALFLPQGTRKAGYSFLGRVREENEVGIICYTAIPEEDLAKRYGLEKGRFYDSFVERGTELDFGAPLDIETVVRDLLMERWDLPVKKEE